MKTQRRHVGLENYSSTAYLDSEVTAKSETAKVCHITAFQEASQQRCVAV